MFDSFDIAEDVGETGLIRDDVYLKVRADILTCTDDLDFNLTALLRVRNLIFRILLFA